jgi:hypothetical protein
MGIQRVALVVSICLSVALFACGKDDKDKADDKADKADDKKPDDKKPDDKKVVDKKADDKKPDDKKPDDKKPDEPAASAEATQCQGILDKAWTAIQPTIAKVDVDPSKLEKGYKSNKQFVERCAKLPADKRDCMEKSDNPVLAIHTCEVNAKGAKPNEKLWAPSVSPRFELPKLTDDESKAQLAAVVGTWVSDWKSFGQVTTWKIAADGAVKETKVRKGETEKADLGVSFHSKLRVKVQTTKTSSQTYAFLMVDKKTFLASSNQAYDAFPVTDKDKFVIWTRSEWLFNDGGKCSVISDRGEEMKATCKWSKQGKTPVITFEYSEPGRFKRDGSPIASERIYHYMADHMVDHRMVSMALFKKK